MTTFSVQFVRGKDRPRFTGNGRTYTTKATRDALEAIRSAYMEKAERDGRWSPPVDADAPYALTVDIYRALPKSRPKRVLSEPDTFKPDADNVAKLVMDALNGAAYRDDSQVVSLCVRKWSRTRDAEGDSMTIRVTRVGEGDEDE